jgi:hypothetical protein
LHDTTTGGWVLFLNGWTEIFSPDDSRPLFPRSVSKRTKGRILLDQVQNFTAGDRFQFRPVSAWLDLHGKVTYKVNGSERRDGICTRSIDEKPWNVYFIVLIHVPSFLRSKWCSGVRGFPTLVAWMSIVVRGGRRWSVLLVLRRLLLLIVFPPTYKRGD